VLARAARRLALRAASLTLRRVLATGSSTSRSESPRALKASTISPIATFSASAYWADVGRYGCTTTALVSAMVSILLSAPERAGDDENPLQDVLMNPLTPESETFATRFGVRVCTDYNMTETSIPLHSGWDISDWRSCGKVRPGPPGYEVRLVDERDIPVAEGEVGELVCRTEDRWAMNAGYLGRPEETATAWRNGWFHTGDAFRVDGGRYYFVDRA
jgi:carnitine-CoA ligase